MLVFKVDQVPVSAACGFQEVIWEQSLNQRQRSKAATASQTKELHDGGKKGDYLRWRQKLTASLLEKAQNNAASHRSDDQAGASSMDQFLSRPCTMNGLWGDAEGNLESEKFKTGGASCEEVTLG